MNPISTFVINLRSDTDRWNRCRSHLDERGYKWAMGWAGVDAEKMGLVTTNSHILPDGRPYTPPPRHVGCCLSHWMLWKELSSYDNGGQWGGSRRPVAIMEDDVELREDWEPMLEAAMKDLPQDWDILFAGSCHVKAHNPTHYKGNLWKFHSPLCTHFYIVNQHSMQILAESCERIYTNIDWAIVEQALPKLNSFVVLPRIAGQHNMELPE